jgi:phage tail-like protein
MVIWYPFLGRRQDPYLASNFLVEVSNVVAAGFVEVAGLESGIEVDDRREGGRNDAVHRLPGPAGRPVPLVLRRGVTTSDELWNWYLEACSGRVVRLRRTVSVLLLDANRRPTWRWVFTGAFPMRWQGPALTATNAAVAIEALELAHEGLDRLASGRER